jgi:hypothetical protein
LATAGPVEEKIRLGHVSKKAVNSASSERSIYFSLRRLVNVQAFTMN